MFRFKRLKGKKIIGSDLGSHKGEIGRKRISFRNLFLYKVTYPREGVYIERDDVQKKESTSQCILTGREVCQVFRRIVYGGKVFCLPSSGGKRTKQGTGVTFRRLFTGNELAYSGNLGGGVGAGKSERGNKNTVSLAEKLGKVGDRGEEELGKERTRPPALQTS